MSYLNTQEKINIDELIQIYQKAASKQNHRLAIKFISPLFRNISNVQDAVFSSWEDVKDLSPKYYKQAHWQM